MSHYRSVLSHQIRAHLKVRPAGETVKAEREEERERKRERKRKRAIMRDQEKIGPLHNVVVESG